MLPQCHMVHIQFLLQPSILRQILATRISLPSWQKPNQTKQNSKELILPLIHKDVFHRSSWKVDQWQHKQLRYLIISCVINKGKHKKDHRIVVFKRSTIYAFYIVNEFMFVCSHETFLQSVDGFDLTRRWPGITTERQKGKKTLS